MAIARTAGLTDAEIMRCRRRTGDPSDAGDGSSDDAVLLAAVDELQDDHRIGDPTWAALSSRYGDEQLIEITMLAGAYAMLAGTLNSLGVQLEGDQPALGEV